MGIFGGGTKNFPSPEQQPLGLDETRTSTNQQARPVPYMAGKTRVGLTWICDAFNVIASPVTQRSGKRSTVTTGYNYYASLAGLACWGPVDNLHEVIFDGVTVWSGTEARAGDSSTITIEGRGDMTIYWGTTTQEASAELLLSGTVHPPYRRQCYVVFDQLYFGFNKTAAPNVELVLSRYPDPTWMTAAATIDGDANPVAILAEWLQDTGFGLGWADSRLDTSALDDIASQLETEGIGLSPYITNQQSVRQLIATLLEYFDGFPILTTAGKFSIGLQREPASIPALTEITEEHLVEPPELELESWEAVKTETILEFTNRDRVWKEDSLPYRDPAAHSSVGESNPVKVQRKWVTKPATAQLMVAALGRANAIPGGSGKLRVLRSIGDTIAQGDQIRFTYADFGVSDVVLRVTERTIPGPASRHVDLKVELDRSHLNAEFYIPPDEDIPEPTTYEAEAFNEHFLPELPWGLLGEDVIVVAPTGARPNPVTTGFTAYIRSDYNYYSGITSTVYNEVGDHDRFSKHGTLNADYSADTPLIDEVTGFDVTLDETDKTLASVIIDQAMANALTAWINGEIISVLTVTLLAANRYRVYGIRARFDTRRTAHSSGDDVWLIPQEAMGIMIDGIPGYSVKPYVRLPAYNIPARKFSLGQTLTLKLQPRIFSEEFALGSVTPVTVDLDGRALKAVAPTNLKANGNGGGAFWTTGQDVELTWTLTTQRKSGFYQYFGDPMDADPQTIFLELRDSGGTLVYSETTSANATSRTWTNAQLQSWLGGEETFTVRAYGQRGTSTPSRSTFYETLTVEF